MMRKINFVYYTDVFCLLLFSCMGSTPSKYLETNTDAVIFPDYTNIMIPFNIAPLNFMIKLDGTKFRVDFIPENKDGFSVVSNTTTIRIPLKKWKKFLASNAGQTIQFNIYVKNREGNWEKYKPIINMVSTDRIDPYIVYRRINACLVFWENMDIVQRSLEDFIESDIISNQNTGKNCMHCHSFRERDPETFLLHMRGVPGGTLIKNKDKTLWLNTKTKHTLSAFVYPAWHPGGRYIAFSTNKIHQSFYGHGDRTNHIRDDASDIVVYDMDSNLVFTTPKLATYDFENLPAWSPDGKYLYYIRTKHENKFLPDTLEKFDLMRIAFNAGTREWGEPEMLVSSEQTGLSASFPQVSPDGKFIIFCMADYGYFDICNSSSDLYLYDLQKSNFAKLPVNSSVTESFPNWSDNGRWIMFTTKRIDHVYTVPHFAYVDSTGHAYKPFPLPLENPEAYFTRLTNYNRPVFVEGKVSISQNTLEQIAYSKPGNVVFDSLRVDLNAISGATVNKPVTQPTSVPYLHD
jgi:hypothetical protein